MTNAGARARFESLFRACLQPRRRPAVIGMVHVQALPGTPRNNLKVSEVVQRAVREARMYQECRVDGVMVENMHDTPYVREGGGPEVTACMTRVCAEVRQALDGNIPLGVQILSGANKEALAVAQAAGANFIRTEGYVFSHVGDEGWVDSCAGELLRYRKAVGADEILIFTDIKKKHSSHAVTSDVDVLEMAQAAEFFLSDGVIVTGRSTGHPADMTEVVQLRDSVSLPVLVGSGVTAENVGGYATADALIVGSHFKEGGSWFRSVARKRVTDFMDTLHSLTEVHA